jgi:hypothetical protein
MTTTNECLDQEACILELRARVEALEANVANRFDHIGLVERVAFAGGCSTRDDARAVIREVAAWLRDRAGGTRACWLLDVEAGE